MTYQPLPGFLGVSAQALNGQPELRRVIGNGQMYGLVRYEVPEHIVWCEDESPVERKVLTRRAVAPFRALVHHIDAMWVQAEASRYDC